MRGDLVLLGLGIFFGAICVISYQKIFGPSSYDECLMATVKTWAPTEVDVANRICYKKFRYLEEKTNQ